MYKDNKCITEQQTISVIMGIYNCEKTLNRTVESIISQTYPYWELVMCDDGSTDDTYRIAESYKKRYPNKIVLLKNETNLGLNITLNKCLHASKGELIARQDADDISLPMRFEKQINYLMDHPDCAFVSCGMIVNNGRSVIGVRIPKSIRPDAKGFMKGNQFYHAPVMIRRVALELVDGYSEDYHLLRVEDYNLWTKLYAIGLYGENMLDAYYEVLEDDNTYKRRKLKYRINGAYANLLAVDMLGLPKWYKVYALRGILIGLIPNPIYKCLHKKLLISSKNKGNNS